jgi:hypothetical protein
MLPYRLGLRQPTCASSFTGFPSLVFGSSCSAFTGLISPSSGKM